MRNMAFGFVLLVLVLIAVGCGGSGCGGLSPDSERGGEIRVMSFNIRYGTARDGQNSWSNRREMVFDVIRDYEPDVLGLQEALKFQVDEILAAVEGYELIGVGREDGKEEGEYSCILYRKGRFDVSAGGTFWLSDTPDVPGSITWGNACTRICTWGRFADKQTARAFYMYNTHLDHVSQPSRAKSVRLVAERIGDRKHGEAYIITGDFNADEENVAVLYLKGKAEDAQPPDAMVDTFRVLHPDAGEVGTFNAWKGERTGGKIDYIFTDPAVKVIEADIVWTNSNGRYPSDHFPVTATLLIE